MCTQGASRGCRRGAVHLSFRASPRGLSPCRVSCRGSIPLHLGFGMMAPTGADMLYKNFPYKNDSIYTMVTLKKQRCHPEPLARLNPRCRYGVSPLRLTIAMSRVIIALPKDFSHLVSVTPFTVMPDHIHLLMLADGRPGTPPLGEYIHELTKRLEAVYRELTGTLSPRPLFEPDWDVLAATQDGALDRFFRYIRENPADALARRGSRESFRIVRGICHPRIEAGRLSVDAVGNLKLLESPVLRSVRLHRGTLPGTPEWEAALRCCEACGPGCAAVGTWWSKAEQEARRRILARGGGIIHLCPHGFGERWHPAGPESQALCADGRLLYLSPYVCSARPLLVGVTRMRCLRLNEIAAGMAAAGVAVTR